MTSALDDSAPQRRNLLKKLLNKARERSHDLPRSTSQDHEDDLSLKTQTALGKFYALIEQEDDIKLRMEYGPIVKGFEDEIERIRERRSKRKLADFETLLASIQQEQEVFLSESRKYELQRNVASSQLWDTLESEWEARPTRSELGRGKRQNGPSNDSSQEWAQKNKELERIYKKLLIRMLNPLMSRRIVGLEFNPDTTPWFEVRGLKTSACRRVYVIAIGNSLPSDIRALLVVKETVYGTDRERRRTEKEEEILAKLSGNDHSVHFAAFRIDEEKRIGRIFLEYLPGGDLQTLIYYNGIIGERESKPILRQILLGLQFLRKMNIVHRAITSQNILIHIEGGIKLGGFGSAREIREGELLTPLIHEADYVGTELWMSPEIARGQEFKVKKPFQTDIWSFGCVIVEVLTGKLPWTTSRDPFSNNAEEAKFCLGIKATLADMGTKKSGRVKGPPFSALLSQAGREVLGKMFVAIDKRIDIDQLSKDPWFVAPPGITMPDMDANDPTRLTPTSAP